MKLLIFIFKIKKLTGSIPISHVNYLFIIWWRRWELNPRPKILCKELLPEQLLFLYSPQRTLNNKLSHWLSPIVPPKVGASLKQFPAYNGPYFKIGGTILKRELRYITQLKRNFRLRLHLVLSFFMWYQANHIWLLQTPYPRRSLIRPRIYFNYILNSYAFSS